MLVLSRKKGQSIHIGDSITVKIIRLAGTRVQLGIEAPGDMQIRRDETAPEPEQPAREPVTMPADADEFVFRFAP